MGLLYAALDAHRRRRGLRWQDCAGEMALSASLFSRLSHGHQPSLDAYVAMCRWLGMAMESFTGGGEPVAATLDLELIAVLHRHGVDGPERDFLLSAYRVLSSWRTRDAAA